MLSFSNITLLLTTLFSGLIAGLLYSYSCSVNPGLKALPDLEYLKAMQSINLAILNAGFFVCFLGLAFLFPATAFYLFKSTPGTSFYLLLAAMLFYFIGVLGITMLGNVPLNELLAKFNISHASSNEITLMRQTFEGSWNRFHSVRTVSSIVSFVLTLLAVFKLR